MLWVCLVRRMSFNSRTPRGVRRDGRRGYLLRRRVSIHAPREGCDMLTSVTIDSYTSFNSRTPRGVRLMSDRRKPVRQEFQFTHPARGATRAGPDADGCGGVSIHAPREGCDGYSPSAKRETLSFQFTHPARGATPCTPQGNAHPAVSIHAPREGCDVRRVDD